MESMGHSGEYSKISRENVKISDAADFNSFLTLVLVSDNEKSPEQA